MRRNRFLRDKMIDKANRGSGRDGRNPYGAKGGYVTTNRDMARGGDRAGRGGRDMNDYESDYAYSQQDMRRRDYAGSEQELMIGGRRPVMSEEQAYGMDSADYAKRRDYGMYDYGDDDYEEKLEKLCKKLKKRDKFKLNEDDIITKAKQMGVKFDDISEEEFTTAYYLMVTDYPSVATQPHTAIAMAKDFFDDDDDIDLTPSEKLYQYITYISMYK